MINETQVFIPGGECSDASGDCFIAGQCLNRCTPCLSKEEANIALAKALRMMSDLREYVLTFRSMTRYVDGSSIDISVKESGKLIDELKRKAQ